MDRRLTNPGLCRACRHARRVHGRGGNLFWLCKASWFDPSMPKYPALPVRRCKHFIRPEQEPSEGFKPSEGSAEA